MTSLPPPFARINRVVLVVGIVCLVTTFVGVILVAARNDEHSASTLNPGTTKADPSTKARVADRFGRLPLSFEVNKGQIEEPVKFLSRGPGYDLFLTASEAVLTLRKPQRPGSPDTKVREGSVLRLKMVGANAAPQIEGQDELPGKVNYFAGSNPEQWLRNIPTYRKVYYKDVYPGIDVVYYGNQREFEYDFVVAPGANPKVIKFTVEGADKISLDQTGNLLLDLKHGEVRLKKPVIYQLTDEGSRHQIKGNYVIKGNEIRFKVHGFDSSKPLVIDPVLSYSTFLGSVGNEIAFGIAVDAQGNAYVTGSTDFSTFPTTAGAFRTSADSGGTFVSKLDATGSTLVYSTFISNNNAGSSVGRSIAVDSSGNAYITGSSSTSDFPIVNGLKTNANFFKTTDSAANWNNNISGLAGEVSAIAVAPNSPNTIYAGVPSGIHRSTDGGVTWTKPTGAGLPSFPFALSLAVDPTNPSVVFAGFNSGGLFKTTDSGVNWSAVSTANLSFSAVLTIVFDPATPSTIYVGSGSGALKSTDSGATWTQINNFGIANTPPVRALAIDPTSPSTVYAGLSGNGGLFKSTNGGSNWTLMNTGMSDPSFINVSSIVIDPSNPSTIYAGRTFTGGIQKSTNGAASWTAVNNGVPSQSITAMVATPAAIYAATSGGGVVKTTNGGTSWTVVDAGLGSNQIRTLVGHPFDQTILYAGTTASFSQDAFVTKLNASGSGLLFSTLLGGSLNDNGNGIAVDGNGNIYVVGDTTSTNFPAVNALPVSGPEPGCATAFVTKINPAAPSYVFSTYLGGNRCDLAHGVALDTSANVYVTGSTSSPDFPTANAFQGTLAGTFTADVFVTKLTTNGALSYSTFLGGTSSETGFAIAVDASGNAYVTGNTTSTNFPTLNPLQGTTDSFTGEAFVTKLNSQGSGLVYSTYLGGASADAGRGIAVDSTGNAYVTGITGSVDFPVTAGALRTRSPIFKSLDGAANWSNDNYGLTSSTATHLVINPIQPWILYAGTGTGVFKTANGGRTWSPVNNGLLNRRVVAMAIDPLTPSTIYVATSDFFSTSNQGVYKSTDGGNSWNRRVNGMANTGVPSLAVDPVTPTTLYAGTSGGPIYKSTDGADSWTPLTSPLTFPVSIAVDPHNHTTVYAAEFSSAGGVFRSVDSGANWQSVGANQTGTNLRSLSVSPLTPGLLYVDGPSGIFRSTDSGDSWSKVQSLANFSGQVVFDPVNASTLYFLSSSFSSLNQGLLKSTNDGQTWVPMNKGLNTPTSVALAIDPLKPSTLHLVSTAASGEEAFVTKINPAGNALVYSTFIGGTSSSASSFGVNSQGFGIAVDSVGNAYVTGLASSNFPTTPNSFQPFNRGGNEVFISKLSMSHLISGQVLDGSNAPVAGVDVVLTDGSSLTSITTEGDGSYQFSRLREGGTFTVSATKAHFTITPSSQTFNNLNSDQVLNFTATATNAPFFTISGQITENGAGLAGVTVTLSGSQPGLRTTDSNGNYSFELAGGGNYTVTPSILGFTFATPSQTFNNLSAPQTANFAATRQNFVVTNDNSHGAGSLRDAILNANATAGADTIVFNIPGPGVKVIAVATALPEITDPVTIDGTTQPGYAGAPLIEINGTFTGSHGLVIKASSVVKGLAIGNFSSGAAIWLRECNNNVIQGNYIGVDATGTATRRNNNGILLSTSSNNLIGGTTAAARNVISGNGFSGIEVGGSGNVIQGNFIGTNAAGTESFSSSSSNGISIASSPFTDNVIGGTTPGAGNLISGNQTGISTNGPGTIIQGNLIGTDITGTQRIPNSNGISATGANILIGGLTPAARNIISGNDGGGVSLGGNGSRLQGNYIGTDITGTLALHNGVGVSAGGNAVIGGTVPGARNVITGSSFANVVVGFNSGVGSAAIIQGNYIGTDVTGTRGLSLDAMGISVSDGNHVIGGTAPGAGNVISGNRVGIQISTSGPQGNTIQGNVIGLNALGTGAVPNLFEGIAISDSTNNLIGGIQSGAANKIAFNGGTGIGVFSGSRNTIRGNSIFSNGGLGIDLGGSGLTPNDTTDSDTGANLLQNFPVLTSVQSSGGSTTIQGSLKSTPNTTFQIDFYSSAALDPSLHGEGALFFNTTSVTTNGSGDATINVTFPDALPAGRAITATATDPDGNTSEFSAGDENAATGSLHFGQVGLQVIEDVGLATITIQRLGGKVGNLSVNYATADGTAIAGQDYTSTSGTLNFGNGETSKTFQIPITEDAITEPDETFTITLSGTSLEGLGELNAMTVIIQDRTTVPNLFMLNTSAVEGGPGTTTQALFTLSLSAATGRTVSVNYATANATAFGGASCGDQGTDYESVSGTFTFQPGRLSTVIPVKVCGDTSAEGNESFFLNLSNPFNATLAFPQATGVIVNDDVLELILEESGPGISQAAALDAYLAIRDPFRVLRIDETLTGVTDKNTRVVLFARNLHLNPGEPVSAVIVRLVGSNNQVFNVQAEDVRAVPGTEFTQVIIKLPDNLPPGTCTVRISAPGRVSNIGSFRITQ